MTKKEKKKTLSARKLEKLKKANISANKIETDDYIIIDIAIVGANIEPSMRHRDRESGGKYDPLNAYKKYLNKVVMEQLNLNEIIEGEFFTHVKYYRTVNQDESELFRLMALAEEIRPLSKPDNDNILKTLQDAFNKSIFNDDIQISKVLVEKFFNEQEMTFIRFIKNKKHDRIMESIKGKRCNKKIRAEYEEKIKNVKVGFTNNEIFFREDKNNDRNG